MPAARGGGSVSEKYAFELSYINARSNFKTLIDDLKKLPIRGEYVFNDFSSPPFMHRLAMGLFGEVTQEDLQILSTRMPDDHYKRKWNEARPIDTAVAYGNVETAKLMAYQMLEKIGYCNANDEISAKGRLFFKAVVIAIEIGLQPFITFALEKGMPILSEASGTNCFVVACLQARGGFAHLRELLRSTKFQSVTDYDSVSWFLRRRPDIITELLQDENMDLAREIFTPQLVMNHGFLADTFTFYHLKRIATFNPTLANMIADRYTSPCYAQVIWFVRGLFSLDIDAMDQSIRSHRVVVASPSKASSTSSVAVQTAGPSLNDSLDF